LETIDAALKAAMLPVTPYIIFLDIRVLPSG